MHPLMGLFSSLASKGKHVILGGLGLFGASMAAPSIQDTLSTVTEKGVEIQSGMQAQNGNIDNFFGGFNRAQAWSGFFAGIAMWLGQMFGHQGMIDWANKQMANSRDAQKAIQNDIDVRSNDSLQSGLEMVAPAAVLAAGTGVGLFAANRIDRAAAARTLRETIEAEKRAEDREIRKENRTNKVTNAADDAGRAGINTADDAARKFTTVTDDAARLLTPDEIARTARGLDNMAPLADDAARATMSLGGKAKIVGALAVGLGAGYSWLTGENPIAGPAQAAVDPNASVDPTATPAAQTDIATGAPVEATLIAGSGAVVAATSLGVKAIPLVGGVVTAADTLWNTGSYLFQGEFSKAGTEFVAGAGLTVGATGGFLTYGLGEAWHAGVRDSAIAVIGSDAEIGKAPLRTVFEMATGVNTDMATAPQPERPTVAAFQAAVANSEIRVPAPAMEYDIMGNATGFSAPSSEGLDLGSSFAAAKDNAPAATVDAAAAAARRRPARGQPVLESHLN